jgi:hypothetical protein
VVEPVGLPLPPERNPFTGKGLAVTVALLLGGATAQSLAQLAERADVSRSLVTLAMRQLLRTGLATGEVAQGRTSTVRPTRALLAEAAAHWPQPVALVVGRPPSEAMAAIGGGPAIQAFVPTTWEAPPRAYVRNRAAADALLADLGGHLVGGGVVDWELAVVDFPFAPGPVPPVIAALELGSTPRGREMLHRYGAELTAGWPAP